MISGFKCLKNVGIRNGQIGQVAVLPVDKEFRPVYVNEFHRNQTTVRKFHRNLNNK